MTHDKESLQRMFLSLRANNEKLQHQFEYLRQHVDASSLPTADGALRELQLKTVTFAKEFLHELGSYDIKPFLMSGALVGYLRHNKGFVPWDDDLDFIVIGQDFWRLIDIVRDNFILIEIPNASFLWSTLDESFKKYPNQIIGLQTPYCLHVYKGTSLEDCANIEFIPYYYYNESSENKDYIYHAKETRTVLTKYNSWNDLFAYYKNFIATTNLYCEKSNKIAPGVGANTLTHWKFPGFFTYEDFFPLQSIVFENVEFSTMNNYEKHTINLYGDYMQLPSDTGITVTSSVVHAYLQTQNRTLNMPEASVTCKHKG